ncbi:uncharacterized protein LOC141600951 [Silene latifolia]|uniref:uncharacterized protein LOC141600951 n=1 Tax=Silene latifolia TaxID=37657 RepID=UPI003D772199
METSNPPLVEMPYYSKFLEEVIFRRVDISSHELDASSKECNVVKSKEFTVKLDDPRSFSIPCTVGDQKVDSALCDLGTSVSVIPLALVKRLNILSLARTSITIKLADGTIKSPIGILKDIMVQIGKLSIPTDFVVLDIPMGRRSRVILGRPFLAMGGATIDVKEGLLSFKVGKEKVEFKLPHASKKTVIKK